ncbi:MAG TPA: ABC transporter substrate-binding protein, partial [Burkholderiales bacterium]|nr:ABC transporter substrate-binding protein [Burkholderiales bacterium]
MIRSHFGVLAVAAMVGVTGCGEDKKAQAPATLTIAIGSVAPLTGGIAHLGKDNENGARLAVEEAKAAKIRIGGREAVFELLAEDDQEDAKVGNTVAQKLVDAKVAGVVGHLNSGTSIPAS